jgi:hypothetical protein
MLTPAGHAATPHAAENLDLRHTLSNPSARANCWIRSVRCAEVGRFEGGSNGFVTAMEMGGKWRKQRELKSRQ